MPENDTNAQWAYQPGRHNIVVQAHGDNINIQVGLPHLKLIPVSARIRTEPRREIDILNPAFQAVPLVGREQDLEYLQHWLSEQAGIRVAAMVGPAGSGKTRLALEILQQMPENWQGGFLTSEEANRFLDKENVSEWSWQKPTIIVVDYAALLTDTLARWFAELADHSAPQYPLRILLLERHADPNSGWYCDLADGTWHGQAVRDLLWLAEPRHIAPLNEMVQRRQVLQAGLLAARAVAQPGKICPQLPNPGQDSWFDQRLAASQWADPLLLLMAAVIAVSDGLNAALTLSRPDLAKKLATRELDRVRKSVEGTAAKVLLAHLYACVTLCGGLERKKAIEVAEQEFAAAHRQYPGGAGEAVEDLARILGARDRLPPLAPDLVGEAMLPIALVGKGAEVTARLALQSAEGVASSLVRSVQDFGQSGEAWPLEWLQFLITEGHSPPRVFFALEAALPNDTTILRGLSLKLTTLIVDKLVQQPRPHTLDLEAYLGHLWDRLAMRQRASGQLADALASSTEASRIRDALAEADSKTFLPERSQSLDTHACMQSEMGLYSEALTSIAQAVLIRRGLAKDDPDTFLPLLAMSLNNQGGFQGKAGRLREGIISLAEAVDIHRTATVDGCPTSLNNLAGSLHNLSALQGDLGQRGEALTNSTEAVRIRRALAETNPDALLPDLAGSLANLAAQQKAIGKIQDALTSATEAVPIHRKLAESNPDAFLPALAVSLKNQAGAHYDLGQHAEALGLVDEAVKIDRALAKENYGAFLPGLADSLQKQALAHSAMGEVLRLEQAREALASITESVRLYRELAGANPDAHNFHLASSLHVLVRCLDQVGNVEEARDAMANYLSALLPLFLSDPPAYEDAAEQIVTSYLARCKVLGQEPDPQLINPFAPLLGKAIMVQIASLAQQAINVIVPLLPFAASHAATQAADGFLRQPGAKLYDWLASKLKGSAAVAALNSGSAETDTRKQLDALRLEIEKLAGSDPEFRQQLADRLKEFAGTSIGDAHQTSTQMGDNNKDAQAFGSRIKIHIG